MLRRVNSCSIESRVHVEVAAAIIVIEFPTMEAAIACFESDAYREASAFRRGGAGIVENVIVEGGDATPR